MIETIEKLRPTTGQRFNQRRLGESWITSTETRRTQSVASTTSYLSETKSLGLKSSFDAGFTLIELMVVLLILAILLAIAIPTFLGVTKSANDRAAQSNLNTALVNAKSIFEQNSQSYNLTGITNPNATTLAASMVTSLLASQPGLSFQSGAVTSGLTPSTISVAVAADGNGVALAEQAKGTGNCWYVIDNSQSEAGNWVSTTTSNPGPAGTWYGEAKAAATCSAASIPTYLSGSVVWSQNSFPSI
jgi:type IV pilus assembly protein PilA